MTVSQVRPPNAKGFLWTETCGQKLAHCYHLDVITVRLSLEIALCTLADMDSSKLSNLEPEVFIIFDNPF